MKITINIIIISIILLMIGCKSKSNKILSVDALPCSLIIQANSSEGSFTDLPYITNFVFYNWYKVGMDVCRVNSFMLKDNFEIIIKKGEVNDIIRDDPTRGYDFGSREGEFRNGVQHGLWECKRSYYLDSLGHHIYKNYKFREEYFKNGLRDSIYKIYNKDGKVIYSTYFKDGNGIEKDFHENGALYYEIETKGGYFTDTLHLYNKEGKKFEKRLYQKDVLVYYAGNDCSLRYKYKPNDSTYLEVDSYEVKNLKQGAFRNTFSYKTKEEFENDQFAKSTLKR
ncbi:hypothetical protein [Flavobacterium pectinovorum]|uniref:Antitoxin component YwqK of the YwqJK toxin-antitoxin module n=1 Tax=Flavobacterium pectinovorum TaxID=29533 RepID=A0A502EVQ2_9FLAO|nr:hypothetical protein [Flavobacterium pectinovorum]TPG41978.1 hypothetical protein EAH81_06550 [Flavobacterium pectinovorum]